MDAYAEADDAVLIALAVKDFAGNLPDVGTLVLSPEMITPLLAKFIAPGEAAKAEPKPEPDAPTPRRIPPPPARRKE